MLLKPVKKSSTKAKSAGAIEKGRGSVLRSGLLWPVLSILLAALLMRALYFSQLKSGSPVYDLLIHDSALFNELAHRVLERGLVGEHAFYISPLYIYFLAAVYRLLGDSFNIVRILQFVMGAGTAVLIYALGRRYFSRTVAWISGLIAALYAPFLFFEGNLLGTSLVTLLLCAALLSMDRIGSGRFPIPAAFCSGLLLALAITGRPNLLLLAPLPLIAAFLLPASRRWPVLFSAAIGLLLPLALTAMHNFAAEKEFIPLTSHGGINFYIGNSEAATGAWYPPEGLEASVSAINLEDSRRFAEQQTGRSLTSSQVSRFWIRRAFTYIGERPLQWLELVGKKFVLFCWGYETPLNFDYYFHQRYTSLLRPPFLNFTVVFPLALVGLGFSLSNWRRLWPLYCVIVLACLSVMLFFMADRYRLPVVPVLILFAGYGIVKLVELWRAPGWRRCALTGALIVLIALQIGTARAKISRTNYGNDYYNIALAHIIEEEYKEGIYWGERAVAADPQRVDAFYNLGIAYLKEGEPEKAFEAFSTVVELAPDEAGAQRNLGGLLLMGKEYRRALEHLRTAVELEPDNISGLMNLGLAHYYLYDFQQAIDAWERLLKIDPDNEQARNNIRAARAQLRRW